MAQAQALLSRQDMARMWTIVATFASLAALMALLAGAAIVARSEPLISQSRAVAPR